jgi:hypothetical protein
MNNKKKNDDVKLNGNMSMNILFKRIGQKKKKKKKIT